MQEEKKIKIMYFSKWINSINPKIKNTLNLEEDKINKITCRYIEENPEYLRHKENL